MGLHPGVDSGPFRQEGTVVNDTLENPDDEFARMMEGIELEEPDDVTDVTTLTDIQLMDLFHDVREQLGEEGEMFSDLQHTFGSKESTREGRDLHSTRLACLVEMRKRGLA